jgi:trigger factor
MKVEYVRVTVEKQPKSSVTLDIAADQDEFDKAVDRAFRRINQMVNIPGFRPGKAPRRMVEQRIGRELIVQEAHREIMDDLYRKALEQEDLVPVSDPEVDVYQDDPLAFKVQVQVYPNIDLGDYESVSVEPREVSLEDGEIDEVIENLRKQHSTWKEPEQPGSPDDGDQVILDLEVFEGDEPFHEPVTDADFVLGEGPLFPRIAESVKQLKPGATAEFEISFDDDDEDVPEDLRGKTLRYKVTLHEYKIRELPDVDDEFASEVAGLENVDELRAAIRRDLLGSKVQQARDEFVGEAFDRFAELAQLEIPDGMIETELDREIEQLNQRLSRDGMSLDEYLRFTQQTVDDLKAELQPNAETRLRNALLLEAFTEAEKIDVESAVEAEIERMVSQSEQPDQMREIYQNDYFRNMIHSQLQTQRVTERLIEVVSDGAGAVTGDGAQFLEEQKQMAAASSVEVTGEPSEGDADDETTEEADESTDVASSEERAEQQAADESADAEEEPVLAAQPTDSDDDESDDEPRTS